MSIAAPQINGNSSLIRLLWTNKKLHITAPPPFFCVCERVCVCVCVCGGGGGGGGGGGQTTVDGGFPSHMF